MNQNEYRDQLTAGIRSLPDDVQETILASFEKLYARGLMAGRQAEVILEEMEDPRRAAENFCAMDFAAVRQKEIDAVFYGGEPVNYWGLFPIGLAALIPVLMVILLAMRGC